VERIRHVARGLLNVRYEVLCTTLVAVMDSKAYTLSVGEVNVRALIIIIVMLNTTLMGQKSRH
jgi:hypothetical protein